MLYLITVYEDGYLLEIREEGITKYKNVYQNIAAVYERIDEQETNEGRMAK